VKGVIENIVRIRKEGKTPFDVLTIDGADYSCFDTMASADLSKGHVVEFDFETSGDYKNIKKIAAVTAPVESDTGNRISRSVAIKAAAAYSAGRGLSVSETVNIAKKFDAYVKTGNNIAAGE